MTTTTNTTKQKKNTFGQSLSLLVKRRSRSTQLQHSSLANASPFPSTADSSSVPSSAVTLNTTGLLEPFLQNSSNQLSTPDVAISSEITLLPSNGSSQDVTSHSPSLSTPKSIGDSTQTLDLTAPQTAPRSLWHQACDGLSSKDKLFIQQHVTATDKSHTDFQTVLNAVQAKKKQCEEGRWKFTVNGKEVVLYHVADRICIWLDKFKQIGDIAVNVDPLHAGLPWAGIRFLLQMAISEREQMGLLFVGLNRVSYLIDRCWIYEILYIQRAQLTDANGTLALKILTSALIELYTIILHFLAKANGVFEKTTAYRTLSAFWTTADIEDLEKKCQSIEEKVEVAARNCERCYSRCVRSEQSDKLMRLLLGLRGQSGILISVENTVEALWSRATDDEQTKILTWTSNIQFERIHNSAREGRTPETGEWLLEHEKFKTWISSNDSKILWLHGIPGAGKTKLVSKVVDHFIRHPNDQAVAYFYCDRNDEPRRQPESILRSFVRQLSYRKTDDSITLQKTLIELYKARGKDAFASGDLTFEECEGILPHLCQSFSQTTLILDALDECHQYLRFQLVQSFERLANTCKNLKIFISSRRDDDIKLQLEKKANIGISATDNQQDISKFVAEAIENNRPSRRKPLDDDLQTEIKRVLLVKSGGMFQWASLQIRQLLNLQRDTSIRERLGKLPKDLKATYEEMITTIRDQDEGKPDIAMRAFKWVMCCARPLSPRELIVAVCQDPETDDPDDADTDIDIHFIFNACQNLLDLKESGNVVQFAHLSVREYFEEIWGDKDADRLVAKVCLSLLNSPSYWKRAHPVDAEEPLSEEEESYDEEEEEWYDEEEEEWYDEEEEESHGEEEEKECLKTGESLDPQPWHLLSYARHWWQLHVGRYDSTRPDARVSELLQKFLGSMNESGPAYRSWHRIMRKNQPSYWFQLRPPNLPVIAICRFGLYDSLLEWWEDGPTCVEQRNEDGQPLLALASQAGSDTIVELLLSSGADVNAVGGCHGNALYTASFCGCLATVELLLSNGADVNAVGGFYGNALQAASVAGHLATAQLLLESGANVNAIRGFHGSALLAASAKGHLAVVELLLSKGADINADEGPSGTAVEAAMEGNYTAVINLLKSKGATLNDQLATDQVLPGIQGWEREIFQTVRAMVSNSDLERPPVTQSP